jgi:alkylmercury lyase
VTVGCCEDESANTTELPSLLRDLPDDVRVIRRVAFSALRHAESLSPEELPRRTGLDDHAVNAALRWLDDAGLVERDAEGRVVGIAGLTLERTRHRLVLDGQGLYTWCAIDAIGIPAALSLDAQVTTSCAHCGASLFVPIDHGGPPADSALRGWVPPTECDNVRADICPLANLFCSREHLENWRAGAGNPQGHVADLDRFAELGRQAWGDLAEENEHV